MPLAIDCSERYGRGNETVPLRTTLARVYVRDPSMDTALSVTVEPGATPCTGTVTVLFPATCRKKVSLTVTYTLTADARVLLTSTMGAAACVDVVGVGDVRTSTCRCRHPATVRRAMAIRNGRACMRISSMN